MLFRFSRSFSWWWWQETTRPLGVDAARTTIPLPTGFRLLCFVARHWRVCASRHPKRPRSHLSVMSSVAVYCRLRPARGSRPAAEALEVTEDEPDLLRVTLPSASLNGHRKGRVQYGFRHTRVFQADSSQGDVFSTVAAPLCDRFLEGFNCTVFAYGQVSLILARAKGAASYINAVVVDWFWEDVHSRRECAGVQRTWAYPSCARVRLRTSCGA